MTRATPILLDGSPIGIYTRGGSWHPTPPGLPHELRVAGDVWRCLFHDRIHLTVATRRPLFGCTIPLHRLLIADPTVPRYELEDTLAHEWSHAVIASGRESPALRRLPKATEEALAELFARELVRSGWR